MIRRIYSVPATQGELYYLRLLLLNVRGATSYEYLRTVDSHLYDSFKEAAIRLHLLADDSEWENYMKEAQRFTVAELEDNELPPIENPRIADISF